MGVGFQIRWGLAYMIWALTELNRKGACRLLRALARLVRFCVLNRANGCFAEGCYCGASISSCVDEVGLQWGGRLGR